MTRSSRQDDATTNQIWHGVMHETARNSARSVERGHRNAQDFVQGQLEDTLDENVELAQKNKQLQAQLEESTDLINFWADNCEAYRRTLDHLSKKWGEAPEGVSDPNLRPQVVEKYNEIKKDSNWAAEKNRLSRERTERRRARDSKRRTKP